MIRHTSKSLIAVIVLVLASIFSGAIAFAQDEGNRVEIDPTNFVPQIDNPYLPLVSGSRWVYQGETEDGLERIEVEVTMETRLVMGVQTIVVHDMAYLDGALIEDTFDWYAQDTEGNVWYFGEATSRIENGTATSTSGSWEAGVDGALPGIVMYGDVRSHRGDTYQQEYYAGEAEDAADLLTINASADVAFGAFEDVVLTYDWTPLDHEAHEIKYYAPGVGMIQEINLITGDVIELIEFTHP